MVAGQTRPLVALPLSVGGEGGGEGEGCGGCQAGKRPRGSYS